MALTWPFFLALGNSTFAHSVFLDIYIEFDPVEGLKLRSLNDAKSAYSCFSFEASFFERCTAPPPTSNQQAGTRRNSKKRTLTEASQDGEERFSCRVAVRALQPVVRPRKDVVSLRLRSETSSSALFVSFEFQIQKSQDALLRVVHRVKVAEADAVSAVATKDESSEIVSSPKALLRLLEPLKRTVEAALIVRGDAETLSAASFHHGSFNSNVNGGSTNNNAILQATSASLLKTETSIATTEFDEFFFRDDREKGGEDDEEAIDMPGDVNSGVVLVFPIKECKAMLQFCNQLDQHERRTVSVHFHWGGRPLLFETSTASSSAQLVLATLDYKLLNPDATAAPSD